MPIVIIGGGILGLATAYRLSRRHPSRRIVLLEKERRVGAHQTGHNSGVLHSGVYYRSGSEKAKNCLVGKQAMQRFCIEQGISHEICGKVIVATRESERSALRTIWERGQANGVPCELIGTERLLEIEPHASGVEALHVPTAGVVDYGEVVERLAAILREEGHSLVLGAEVRRILNGTRGCQVETTAGDYAGSLVVNCAGLHSDRIARLRGRRPEARIVPFRGEYFELVPSRRHLCRHLIYPVPDPGFPFLGVHFTRGIRGEVECGPNAVLAFAREGYDVTDIDLRDLVGTLTYPGFVRLSRRYWRLGLAELWRSLDRGSFLRALRRLVPDVREEDLRPAPAGVRAQALGRSGDLIDDFLIQEDDSGIDVCNAPSPAATAAFAIADRIVDRIEARLR